MHRIALHRFACLAIALFTCGAAQAQAKPGTKESKGTLNEALLKAIESKDLARSRALLDQGADANAADSRRVSPLDVAAATESIDILKLLLDRGAKPDGVALAYSLRLPTIPKLLLDHGADPNFVLPVPVKETDMSPPKGVTVLMLAAMLDNAEAVTVLLEKGARLDAKDAIGGTALSYAIDGGFVPRPPGSKAGIAVMRLLLDRGALTDTNDIHQRPLLVAAVHIDRADMALLLLAHGAKINADLDGGSAALWEAVSRAENPAGSRRAKLAMIKMLLDHGAGTAGTLRRAKQNRILDVVSLLETGKMPTLPARRQPVPTQELSALAKPILKLPPYRGLYIWQSDHSLLLSRLEERKEPQRSYAVTVWVLRDLLTGQEKALPGFRGVEPAMLLSPDGKWALNHHAEATGVEFLLHAVEGTKTVRRSVARSIVDANLVAMAYGGELAWMRDSRRWLWHPHADMEYTLHFYLYGLDSPGLLRSLKVAMPKERAFFGADLPPEDLLGITADGLGLLAHGTESRDVADRLELFTFRMDRSSTAQAVAFTLPATATAFPALSPTGDRIAWELYVEGETHDTLEIWISRTDGSGMHALGKRDIEPGSYEGLTGAIKWLPGGKSLSFLYQDRLYTLPVSP